MIKVCLIFLLGIGLAACANSKLAPPGSLDGGEQTTAMTVAEYRIGVDDQLSVNVWRNPELSVIMPVRPDGMISVPLIGDVQAGGRKPEDVAEEIKKKLSVYVRNPNVTVILTELRNFEYISRIRVTGAVQTPTSFAYRQGMTVLDAVLEAGGINEFASPDRARLYRRQNGKTSVYDISLGGILNKGELSTNYFLKPGDIITGPERFF
jgi:polysaccharide export outer membrane protein